MGNKIIYQLKGFWRFLWSDSTIFRKSWLFLILPLIGSIITYRGCFSQKPSDEVALPNKSVCDGSTRFTTHLMTFALLDLDSGRQMEYSEYRKTDESKMYEERLRSERKVIDKTKLIKGYELTLMLLPDEVMMAGVNGFPMLQGRVNSAFAKLAVEDIKLSTKEMIKEILSLGSEDSKTISDGLWAVKTGSGNFAVVSVKGLPPVNDYPSHRETNVHLEWCLYKVPWYEF
ncbi:MAG: hypothetical protein H7235_01645 [Bdellovibrionaceae bacterium]|nr:hypothetical protein [Pseudobdellovibrionaceae bacterium]